ncbi:hypothetical protein P154DRAFT_451218, partial [Amniculicola lignicola CBS 123094]
FLSLYNKSLGKYLFSSIFKMNTLLCRSSSPISSIYPIVYFINYSYTLNTYNS